jgi:CHAT domain-containing protein/Flp pilus assembly protein TadD
MKKIISIVVLLGGLISLLTAQNIPQKPNKTDKKGQRQGKWVLTYDQDGQLIQRKKDSIAYYRLIEYKDDKPIGMVKDYSAKGILQFEARLLEDDPEDIIEGIANYYDKDGVLYQQSFYREGKIDQDSSLALMNKLISKLPPKSLAYAEASDFMGQLYEGLELYKEAELFYQNVRSIFGDILGTQHSKYAGACDALAKVYFFQGLYHLAEPLFIEGKEIVIKTLGKKHLAYTIICSNLAKLYQERGLYKPAEELLIEALRIRAETLGKDHPDYAETCNSLAKLYQDQGLYEQAEALFIEAKKIIESSVGKEDERYTTNCMNLGILYYEQGLYDKAELLYLEVKAIDEKILGKENLNSAVFNNLAELYKSQGLFNQAEDLYLEALLITEKILGKEHPNYAIYCSNLGVFYNQRGEYQLAESLLLQAKNIQEKVFGKAHLDYAISCNNLARVYDNLGKSESAEALYLEAMQVVEKKMGKNHPDYATPSNNLAMLYLDRGLYEQAEALLIAAKNNVAANFGKNHPDYGSSCQDLAYLYQMLGKYKLAETLYYEAAQTRLRQTGSNFSTLSEQEKNAFLSTFYYDFEAYNSFVVKVAEQIPALKAWMYNYTLILKGLLFHSSDKMKKNILGSGNEVLISQYKTWKAKKEYLLKVYQMPFVDKKAQNIDDQLLEIEVNELEKQLSQQSELFTQVTDNQILSWVDIQKALKPNEAAIEIIRTRYFEKGMKDSVLYIALIVKPETINQPEMVVFGNGKAMEKEYLEYYRKRISENLRADIRGDSLNPDDFSDLNVESVKTEQKIQNIDYYGIYWEKIAQKLKNTQKVYLSQDGVYNQLNLNTLQNPQTQKYVLDELEIQLVGNTKDILQEKNKPKQVKKSTEAVLIGFPDYNHIFVETTNSAESQPSPNVSSLNLASTRLLEAGNIKELPETKTEIANIRQILQSKKFIIQDFIYEKATEGQLKKIKNPQILHLATHGFFLNDVSIKEDRDKKALSGIKAKKLLENPLLRAGLLFAGCKKSLTAESHLNPKGGTTEVSSGAEDGILTAYEAMNLELENTEMVVMSACETGLGEIQNGEGVYGLQRAFQQAGAKSVLMSLWAVNDASTQQLMTYFYENWITKQMTKRQAFITAQKQLRLKFPQPYYWGAFVMVGE